MSDFLSTNMKTVRPWRLEASHSDMLPKVQEFRYERRRGRLQDFRVQKMGHSVIIATYSHKENKSLKHIRRLSYAILWADIWMGSSTLNECFKHQTSLMNEIFNCGFQFSGWFNITNGCTFTYSSYSLRHVSARSCGLSLTIKMQVTNCILIVQDRPLIQLFSLT